MAINQKVDRRSFLKMASLFGASSMTGMASVMSMLASKANAGGLSAGNIASLLSIDPITLEYRVFGPCCVLCPTNLIVKHYQPVLLIEVIRGAADSIFAGPGSASLAPAGVVVHTKRKKNFAVRIWEVPDWAIDIAMGFQSCKLCGSGKAPKNNMGIPSSSFLASLCSSDSLITEALEKFNDVLPACFPKLLYDTNFDIDWRTGCSDQNKVNAAASLACTSSGILQGLAGGGIPGITDYCIGNWGPLYPRQMAWHNSDPKMGAAIASMRALSLAGEKGYIEYSTQASIGKLQLTSPLPVPGFIAGTTPARASIESAPASPTGVYSFVWWLPVTCCKSISSISGLCAPLVGCLTNSSPL
jgi:hypothetical protein